MKNIYLLQNEKYKLEFQINKLKQFLKDVLNDDVNYEELEKQFLISGYFGDIETKNILEFWGRETLPNLRKEKIRMEHKLNKVREQFQKVEWKEFIKCY